MKTIGALILTGLLFTACGRPAPWPSAAGVQADSGDSNYHQPPQLRRAERRPDGGVTLFGRSLPGAIIHVASPAGHALEARADVNGDWAIKVPGGEPEIYALAAETKGRRDRAEGYVAVLPGSGPPAALLRAGTGALVLAGGGDRLAILAVDTDASGALVVSGLAPAGQPLRLLADGGLAAEGAAEPDGRFAIGLPKPLNPGTHLIAVFSQAGKAQATVELGPPTAFEGGMRASKRDWGWRLDWAAPSGGVQTTELFSPSETEH